MPLKRRLIVMLAVTVGYVGYKITSPVLLPFVALVVSLNALFNRDLVWQVQVRGSQQFGLNPGLRTPRWDQVIELIGGLLLIVLALIAALIWF